MTINGVPHSALHYEVTIRYYGALSTTIRKRFGWIEDGDETSPPEVLTVEEEDSDFVKVRKRNWARLIQNVWVWIKDIQLNGREIQLYTDDGWE